MLMKNKDLTSNSRTVGEFVEKVKKLDPKTKIEKFANTFVKVKKNSGVKFVSEEYVMYEQTVQKISELNANTSPQEAATLSQTLAEAGVKTAEGSAAVHS